jgi:hypothetical protein
MELSVIDAAAQLALALPSASELTLKPERWHQPLGLGVWVTLSITQGALGSVLESNILTTVSDVGGP